jgi:hypothetical protein
MVHIPSLPQQCLGVHEVNPGHKVTGCCSCSIARETSTLMTGEPTALLLRPRGLFFYISRRQCAGASMNFRG